MQIRSQSHQSADSPEQSTTATRQSTGEPAERRRVLVADESAVVRLFAHRILSGRGHEVAVATCGDEAVATFRRQPFDVVLVDLELPDLDGFGVIDVMHAEKGNSAGTASPMLFVMSANPEAASKARNSLEYLAGILPKPLTLENLAAAVERGEAPSGLNHETAPYPTFDWDAAADKLGGRYEMLPRLAGLLCDECITLQASIADALTRRDADLLRRSAHTLKGSAGVFVARPTVASAKRLEEMAKSGDWARIADAARELSTEVDKLTRALSQHVDVAE